MKKYLIIILGIVSILAYFIHPAVGVTTAGVGLFCDTIDGNIALGCGEPDPVGGVEDLMYLFNYEDKNLVNFANGSKLTIEEFTLNSGKYLYRVEGKLNSNNTQINMQRLKRSVQFEHIVDFIGIDLGSLSFEQYEKVCKSKLVAIVVSNYKNAAADNSIRFFGFDRGLKCSVMKQNMGDDSEGAVLFTLENWGKDAPAKNYEPHVPYFYFDTDLDTSRANLEALVAP
jgi:hypothetical protein